MYLRLTAKTINGNHYSALKIKHGYYPMPTIVRSAFPYTRKKPEGTTVFYGEDERRSEREGIFFGIWPRASAVRDDEGGRAGLDKCLFHKTKAPEAFAPGTVYAVCISLCPAPAYP